MLSWHTLMAYFVYIRNGDESYIRIDIWIILEEQGPIHGQNILPAGVHRIKPTGAIYVLSYSSGQTNRTKCIIPILLSGNESNKGSFKCYVMLFSREFDPTHPLVTLITLNLIPS